MKFIFLFFYSSPLHIAVKSNNCKIVELLLKHKGVDVNVLDHISHQNLMKFHNKYSFGKKPVDYAENDEMKKLFSL